MEIVCVEMEMEKETGKCLWLCCVTMKLGATTTNSRLQQWLVWVCFGKFSAKGNF
jgi:hypothetical protein